MKIEEKRVNEKEKDKKIMKSDDRFHEDNFTSRGTDQQNKRKEMQRN